MEIPNDLGFVPDAPSDLGFVPDAPKDLGFVPDRKTVSPSLAPTLLAPGASLGLSESRFAPDVRFKPIGNVDVQAAHALQQEKQASPGPPLVIDFDAGLKLDKVTPEEIKTAFPSLSNKAAQRIAGFQQGATGVLEGLTTPEMMGLGTVAAAPKAVKQALGYLFAGQMGEQVLPGLAKAQDLYKAGKTEEAAKALTETVSSGLIAASIASEGLGERVPEVTTEQKVLLPKTAAAVEGKAEPIKVSDSNLLNPQPDLSTSHPLAQPLEVGPGIVGLGGATAEEMTPKPENPVGIKNAQSIEGDKALGVDTVHEVARRDFGTVWDEAKALIDADPKVPELLVQELKENPGKPLTDQQDAILTYHERDVRNEFNRISTEAQRAIDDGREEDAAALAGQQNRLSDQLLELHQIERKAGTANARGLNARKMMVNEDFTLAALEMKKRAAVGNRPLTDAERVDLVRIADDWKRKSEALEASLQLEKAQRADEAFKHAAEKLEMEAKQTKASPYIIGIAEKIAAQLKASADESRAFLRGKAFSLDPEVLYHIARVGADNIATVGLDLAKWSVKMVEEFGDKITPHLKQVWEESQKITEGFYKKVPKKIASKVKGVVEKDTQQQFQDTIDKVKAKVEGGTPDDIHFLVQKLYRFVAEKGVRDREGKIDAVHDILKGIIPEITRRDTRDAISGYGRYRQLTKAELDIEQRQHKQEMQAISKLEDMEAGQAPKKTGQEQQSPSDEMRRLNKQVEEAKKKGGYVVTNPETQLRSAIQATETRLKNQITDLTYEIETKTRIVRNKTASPTTPEIEALKATRDELKKQHAEIFQAKGLSDEVRVRMAIKSAERSLAEYERRIREGELVAPKKVSKTPETPELLAVRASRDAAKAQLEELQALANKKAPGESANKAFKTRTTKRIEEIQKKIAAGDFSTRPKQPPVILSAENMKLKADLEKTRDEFDKQLMLDKLAKRGPVEKMQDALVKWRRGYLLSGIGTLGKLTSAGLQRIGITGAEEVIGGALSKIIPYIAETAPREGGLNASAYVKGITEGFTQGMKDAAQTLRTGKSDLDLLYGKKDVLPQSAIDFFGHLHGALKSPVKRHEFTVSFEKRAQYYHDQGLDITDPMLQTKIGMAAYKDANRSIFLQDNAVVTAYKRALNSLKEPNKLTGKVSLGKKTAATTLETVLPIVKVPTNIVGETLQYATGAVTGSIRLADAFRKGVESLSPEDADLIMRSLKKGSIGAAVLTLGFLNPENVGGLYVPGKRDPKDVKFGGVRVYGVNVPPLLLHSPLMLTLQLGATIRRVADSKLSKKDKESQGLTAGIIAGTLGLAEEVPFGREIKEAAKLLDPRQTGKASREMGKSILIPRMIQEAAEQLDKNARGEVNKRAPSNFLQELETGIPYLRQNVPMKKGQ